MKKAFSLILVLAICLSLCACGNNDACSCDCAQCAKCEKKTQNTVAVKTDQVDNISEEAKQNENVIEFETPIVVAEDEYLRVEAVKFYQDYRTFDVHGYPSNADATTEGATLEKYVVFKYCNKTDHALRIQLDEIYLGSDSAFSVYARISDDVAAGKNVLREHIIQTGGEETLKSMEELYSLDGDFYIFHVGDDDVGRDRYTLKFSIPNGMNSGSAKSASLENSIYLGKWQVTDIKFASDAPLENDFSDEEWEIFFEAMLKPFDNIYFVFTESGDCYYHTENGTKTGKWKETETGMQAGGTVFVAEGSKLVAEQDGYLLYWEKVSDSKTVPEA